MITGSEKLNNSGAVNRLGRLVLMVSVAVAGLACAPTIPVTNGKPLGQEKINEIVRGVTTRQQLLDRFGMPNAIAEKDEIVLIKQPAHWVGSAIRPGIIQRFNADVFFEFFTDKIKAGSEHRVYYYMYSVSSGMSYFVVTYISEKRKLEVDKFWVLVNEKAGIVEDYYYRPVVKAINED